MEERKVAFIISTTGEGEPTDTMKVNWKFLLKKNIPKNALENLSFTCFGLGDSTYPLYNAMALKLTQRLKDLGASMFHEISLGDY